MKKLFVTDDAQYVAIELSFEDAPKFDSRLVAMGFEVDHGVFMKALREHLDELNEYGDVEGYRQSILAGDEEYVTAEYALINAVQAIGLQGFTEGFNSAAASFFNEYMLHYTIATMYWKLPLEKRSDMFKYIDDAIHMDMMTLEEGHAVNQIRHKRSRKPKAAVA